MKKSRFHLVFLLFFVVACSDEMPNDPGVDSGADMSEVDARSPNAGDGGVSEVDAQTFTLCGSGPDQTECEWATEICVLRQVDGIVMPSCEPLPDHCDSDARECDRCAGACTGTAPTCVDHTDMNTITCE